jgi:hypothetical protein
VESFSWQLAISSDTSLDGRILANLPRVSALAYDPWYDRHVLAVEGGYTLEFEIYPLWNRDEPSDPPLDIDSLDLSDQLDSPITELKWGLPLFYEVRNQW